MAGNFVFFFFSFSPYFGNCLICFFFLWVSIWIFLFPPFSRRLNYFPLKFRYFFVFVLRFWCNFLVGSHIKHFKVGTMGSLNYVNPWKECSVFWCWHRGSLQFFAFMGTLFLYSAFPFSLQRYIFTKLSFSFNNFSDEEAYREIQLEHLYKHVDNLISPSVKSNTYFKKDKRNSVVREWQINLKVSVVWS